MDCSRMAPEPDQSRPMRVLADRRGLGEPVQAAQDLLVGEALGPCRLLVVLVVDRDVEEDILGLRPVHPLDAIADDRRELVGVCRVVAAHVRDVRGEQVRVTVIVLQSLAGEGGPSGGRAHQEAATTGIAELPHLVAGPLEAEHRVEDVERDHREPVRGI